jgi:hypothetical protein
MFKILISVKNTNAVPIIKNGAKGISLLIVRFLNNLDNEFSFETKTKISPVAAPTQKARVMAEITPPNPRSQPIANANLASPNPIHFPPEISQKKAKGAAAIGPAKTVQEEGARSKNSLIFIGKILIRERIIKV